MTGTPRQCQRIASPSLSPLPASLLSFTPQKRGKVLLQISADGFANVTLSLVIRVKTVGGIISAQITLCVDQRRRDVAGVFLRHNPFIGLRLLRLPIPGGIS